HGHGAHGSLDDRGRVRNKSDHRTIVVRVDVSIEDHSAAHRTNRPRDLFDYLRLAALTKVWYTLNQHKTCTSYFELWSLPLFRKQLANQNADGGGDQIPSTKYQVQSSKYNASRSLHQ